VLAKREIKAALFMTVSLLCPSQHPVFAGVGNTSDPVIDGRYTIYER